MKPSSQLKSLFEELNSVKNPVNLEETLDTKIIHMVESLINLLEKSNSLRGSDQTADIEKKISLSIKTRDPAKLSRLLKRIRDQNCTQKKIRVINGDQQ